MFAKRKKKQFWLTLFTNFDIIIFSRSLKSQITKNIIKKVFFLLKKSSEEVREEEILNSCIRGHVSRACELIPSVELPV